MQFTYHLKLFAVLDKKSSGSPLLPSHWNYSFSSFFDPRSPAEMKNDAGDNCKCVNAALKSFFDAVDRRDGFVTGDKFGGLLVGTTTDEGIVAAFALWAHKTLCRMIHWHNLQLQMLAQLPFTQEQMHFGFEA